MKRLLFLAASLALATSLAHAQSGYGASGTSTLSVTVSAEAQIQVEAVSFPNTTFSTSTNFSNYTATTIFDYKIRTAKGGTGGAVTLAMNGAFSDGTGDSIALNNLTYTSAITAPATGTATGVTSTTANTTSTPLATFGADTHSANIGTTGSTVNWTLQNLPQYVTGTYTATATLTISAA